MVLENYNGSERIEEQSTSHLYNTLDTVVGLWGKENVVFNVSEDSFVLPAKGDAMAQTYQKEMDSKFHPIIADYSA